jgi:hypothetical protein
VPLERLAWHYTIFDRFVDIVADGEIRPATAAVPNGERPIVWFSLNQHWEQTANKALRTADGRLIGLDMQGTMEHGRGLIRIGVRQERAPHTWRELKRLAGMGEDIAGGLVRMARRDGADPRDWRGTFDPVQRADWSTVETFVDGSWVEVELEDDA